MSASPLVLGAAGRLLVLCCGGAAGLNSLPRGDWTAPQQDELALAGALARRATDERLRGGAFSQSTLTSPCPAGCSQEECGTPDPADISKPIVQVLAEKPGINGFCYFFRLGCWWFELVPLKMAIKTWLPDVMISHGVANQPLSESNVTLTYDDPAAPGGVVSLRTHLLPSYGGTSYDIPYCHALGWLRGMGLDGDLVRNFTAWQNLGESECQRLKQLEGFQDDQFTLKQHMNLEGRSARAFRAHVYGKCLTGSVGDEMQWCYFGMGCMIGDDYVGHGSECH